MDDLNYGNLSQLRAERDALAARLAEATGLVDDLYNVACWAALPAEDRILGQDILSIIERARAFLAAGAGR